MEQFSSRSFEEIDEKSKKAEELVKAGQVDSYESAEELAGLILRKERPEGQYKRDAGIEAEEMLVPLLKEIPGAQEAFLSSEYDDKFNKTAKFDAVLLFRGGENIAIQISDSHSKERQLEKINAIKTRPVIDELHNDDGKVIFRRKMPVVLVSHDIKSLLENISKIKTSSSSETESVKAKILKKTLNDIIYSLKFSSGLYDKNTVLKKFLRDRIEFFEKELDDLESHYRKTG